MRTLLLLLFTVCTLLITKAQTPDLSYYFADPPLNTSGGQFNPKITSPKDYLGYHVGEWHVSHDQLVGYMKTIAAESDRISIETYARSYENRPLLLLTITSPANHKNINQIQSNHKKLYDGTGDGKMDISKMPAIIYQGYSVHGNEASGANAAVLYAYFLAAAQGQEIENILNNTVVLLDPCFNPDGLHRFAGWVNSHKSYNLVADGESRELNEVWPGGRTNHYWFDLNRDWLLLAHPESRGRIRNFQKWKPNILTDHHEMGSNSTFFFQPGIPTRTNPLTPKRNQELTQQVATFHAKALDKIGSLYYSQESFDDFYYGKGSTYPDVQGCIGILFEQGSARGHLHESQHGDLSFPFAVRNQLTTSLSTLEAGYNMRGELLEFQQSFFGNSRNEAARDRNKSYTFSNSEDPNKLRAFLKILVQHDIKVYKGNNDEYVVPTSQSQYRLIKGIFDRQTSFTDSLFYDVSAWTLPLAFNIDHKASTAGLGKLGQPLSMDDIVAPQIKVAKSNYAYLFEWNDYLAPRALYHLQKQGLRAKVANQAFTVSTAGGERTFGLGTILVPAQNQSLNSDEVYQAVQQASKNANLQIYAAKTGFTSKGIDLGSPSFSNVKKPKLLLVVGEGVSSYDAGEVWHLMDQRYHIPTTMVDVIDFNNADLEDFTTIAMTNGSYSRLGKRGSEKIKTWVESGGTLIAMRGAVNWAKGAGLANVNFKTDEEDKSKDNERRPYNKRSADSGSNVIGGAIYEVKFDATNPLFYGYQGDRLPVFRRGTSFMKVPKNKYASPAIYTDKPLLAGYSSAKNVKKAAGAAAIIACRAGSGRVICMSDNPNFRAFWYGTNKLFANALFFGNTLNRGALENAAPKKN